MNIRPVITHNLNYSVTLFDGSLEPTMSYESNVPTVSSRWYSNYTAITYSRIEPTIILVDCACMIDNGILHRRGTKLMSISIECDNGDNDTLACLISSDTCTSRSP